MHTRTENLGTHTVPGTTGDVTGVNVRLAVVLREGAYRSLAARVSHERLPGRLGRMVEGVSEDKVRYPYGFITIPLGRTSAPEWTVEADGYRLVIKDGAMVGLEWKP